MQPIELPGKLESLEPIRDYIKAAASEAGLDKKRTYRLILAVDEIATNSILHGYGEAEMDGDLDLWAEIIDSSLTVIIEDTAPPYEPPKKLDSEELDSPLEERQLGGLGVFLAIHNVDEFRYEHLEQRNRHTFIMNSVFSTADKIAILKRVRLFAETPEPILSELAQVFEETHADPGEIVFGYHLGVGTELGRGRCKTEKASSGVLNSIGTVAKASAKACDRCHEVGTGDMYIPSWQKIIKKRYQEVSDKVERKAYRLNSLSGSEKAQLQKSIDQTRAILESVKADGSWGVHNLKYTEALLLKADTIITLEK